MTTGLLTSVALLSAVVAQAPDAAFFEARVLDAAALEPAPQSPADPRWAQATPKVFRVSAQRTVRLTDAAANAQVRRPGVRQVTVRAAASKQELAVLLEWSDATEDRLTPDENGFGDAAAIELPLRLGPGERLPYVGMGDRDSPVLVYLQRGGTSSAFVAEGFGSLTRLPQNVATSVLERDAKQGRWRALFRRPLVAAGHSLERGLVPLAVAVWDGARAERGGNKQLSAWHFVRLARFPLDAQQVAEESWGFHGELGDPARGRALVETVCVACHQMPGKRTAPQGLAPDLSDIGITSTLPYLRDSVQAPSKVIVQHLQPNAHVNRAAAPDPTGAYPNQDLSWFLVQEDGKRVSKMPPFSFPPAQLADIVAFLQTLDGSSDQ